MDRERVQRQDNGTGREVPVSDGDVGSASGADDIVTAKNGARVKLRGPIENPWSHGEKWKQTGWSCSYCIARKASCYDEREDCRGVDSMECHQKNGTISGFIPKMLKAQSDIFATLKHDERVTRSLLDRINEVINRRTRYLLNETLMLADFQNLQQHKEVDPCSMMMDVALFDEENPIMDWLSNSMTESAPILDEYDDYDDDWTTPGGFLIDELQMQPEEVAAFKRKLCFGRNGGQKKGKVGLDDEEEFVDDYESDSAHGSPVYAETEDSSSASEEDGDGADDVGGDQSGGGIAFGEAAKKHGAGSSGRRARGGGAACRSGVTIGRPSCSIRPRSTRKKKQTLKAVSEL